MSRLPDLVLTNAGVALLAKTPLGSQIPVTKWQIGTGVLPNGTDTRDRTQLVEALKDIPISAVINEGNQALVKGQFINTNLEAFTWSETGLFANDPDVGEVLYAYGNAGSEGAPIPDGNVQFREIEFGVQLVFDIAANVTAVINRTLVFATLKDLENYIPKSEKGAAYGVPTLDENLKIPLSQLPDGVLSAPVVQVEYNGGDG